jgi:hypothetical protein
MTKGVFLLLNHHDIRKKVNGQLCPLSYLRGMVSAKGEGMAGHHATYTLGVIDEASGVDDMVYTQMDTWCGGGIYPPIKNGKVGRKLIFGNCNPCNNFFYNGIESGDVVAET